MLASPFMDPALPLARPHWLDYCDRLDPRPLSAVDLVVLHCTELPDMDSARQYGERVLYASGTGNSGHFYIDRDGQVEQYVPLERIAHHVRGYNARAVGIELVNRGRWPHWLDSRHQAMDEPYTSAQLDVLLQLLDSLGQQLPQLRWVAGHEDLDRERVPATDAPQLLVARKRDPGPQFPWAYLLANTGLQRLQPPRSLAG